MSSIENKGKVIYLDNAATTKMSEEVKEAMDPYLEEKFGNASTMYGYGETSRQALEKARKTIAGTLEAKPSEIFFTSGGSESDNWAVKCIAGEYKHKGKHIITTKIEHHAILHTCEWLEKHGYEVTYLDVDSNGLVDIDEFCAAIKDTTIIASIMYANNEIGTIQPIAEIGALCRARGIPFHTDAVQAAGHVPVDVKAEQIDLLSLSGHKLHAPKGVGALYCRKGLRFPNLIDGGAQERGRRAGTENVAGIVALGKAASLMREGMEERMRYVASLRDRLIDGALKIERSRLNGDREKRLPGNASFCFEGVEGESLLLLLDFQGISGSSGSACTSGSLDPSHVLLSIGLPHEIAHGSLRLTLDENHTVEDVDYILEKLPPVIDRLREMSPLWERIKNGEIKC